MARILIVEDEILVACEMQAILEDEGHEVVGIAADLAAADRHLGTAIELALVDLNLRDGLTGPEIARRISSTRVPVIFVTANPRQIGEGIAGTIGVLTKPTDADTIIAAVTYALDFAAGRRAATPPAAMRLFR